MREKEILDLIEHIVGHKDPKKPLIICLNMLGWITMSIDFGMLYIA